MKNIALRNENGVIFFEDKIMNDEDNSKHYPFKGKEVNHLH